MTASLERVYINCEKDYLHKKRNFVLTKSLPSKWEDDFSFYPDGQFISYIESDSEYEIFESDNPTPHNPFKWCRANMVVGGTAMFEKQGRSLELVSNFKSTLHMTCDSVPESKRDDEVNVPSDARFIVRYHDQLDDSDHLILLKKLPTSWCDEVPIYQLNDYVWDLNEDNKYMVEGPYGTIGSAYDWGVSTLGVGYAAGFKVKGDTLEFEEIYSRPFVTEDTVTHIGGKIAYISKGTYDSTNYDVSGSSSEYADNVDPSDMGVSEEEQPKEERPTLTHGYLVCHKVNNEKRYVLMWELPIHWTSLDSIIYNKSDIIEDVVPGTKYSFTTLNMSAYAYGEEYMRPGDIISCAMVNNRIDRFVRIDRYLVRCVTNTDSKSDAEDSSIVDEVDESVDQLLQETSKPVQTPCYLFWYKKDDKYQGVFLTEMPKEVTCDYEFPDDNVIDYLTEDSDYYYINHEKGDAYRYAKAWLGVDDCYLVMVFPDDKYHIGYFTRKGQYKVASDNVNHPSHYTSHPSGIECIDITKHHDFCIGNAIKYLWRQGLKQDADKSVKEKQIEDLKKAIWYINAEIDLIEKDRQGSEL